MSVDAILKEIQALSTTEQAELLDRLSEQFAPTDEGNALSPELKAELERRDAEYEANPANVYTWEQVVEYVKRKK